MKFNSYNYQYYLGIVIRIGLLFYGDYLDQISQSVKYTDIDYTIFTDAA